MVHNNIFPTILFKISDRAVYDDRSEFCQGKWRLELVKNSLGTQDGVYFLQSCFLCQCLNQVGYKFDRSTMHPVQPDQGSNSRPSYHDSTFHVTSTPALKPLGSQWLLKEMYWHIRGKFKCLGSQIDWYTGNWYFWITYDLDRSTTLLLNPAFFGYMLRLVWIRSYLCWPPFEECR